MIAGLVLRYFNGECLVIRAGYETALPRPSRVPLTRPNAAGQVKERASIIQNNTQKPVHFEITEGTRKSIARWIGEPQMIGSEHLWSGRFHERLDISTLNTPGWSGTG